MQINLKGKNIELTEPIKDYVIKRMSTLERLLGSFEKDGEAWMECEVIKTTNHHKAGEIFGANCRIKVSGENFFAESENEDLYAAIDATKEKLFMEIEKTKDRELTLMKRGAKSIKKMLKGLSKRNPFTSKY